MMVKVLDPGMQAQKLLSAFSPSEFLPISLLTPCRTMGLLDDVITSGREDDVLVIDVNQARNLSYRSPITPQLIGMDDLWNIVFIQQPGQEGLRRFSVPMPLKENVEHEPLLVHGPPKPVSNAIHSRTDLVEMPPGTPARFPVAQFFSEERSEFNAPLAEGLMAHLNAALVEQFLDVTVTEEKAMVQLNRVLNDRHRKAVAVGLDVGHGGSAYPDPVKAT